MFAKLSTVAALVALTTSSLVSAAPAQPMDKRIMHSGQATYYAVGLGACGWTNGDNEFVVALNQPQYERNNGGNCGQTIRVCNEQNGNCETAKVVDECPGCADGSLDMAPALFSALNNGNMDAGVFPISWHFNKKN